MKKIAALLTLLSIVTGCQKDTPGSQVPEQQSLTVLFSPGVSFNGAGYDDAILKAVVESMAEHPQVNHSLLRPETLDEARGMALQWQENAGERSMLLLCGVPYEAIASALSPGKGRVLLLDSRQTLENGVATLQLKRYATVSGSQVTSAVTADYQWKRHKASDGVYTLFPVNTTERRLYCSTTSESGSQNCMNVGAVPSGDVYRSLFSWDAAGHIFTAEGDKKRYLSCVKNAWYGETYPNSTSYPAAVFSFYVHVP